MPHYQLTVLENYHDKDNNIIEYDGSPINQGIQINFSGVSNKLVINKDASFSSLLCNFNGSNGLCSIGDVGGPYPNHKPKFSCSLLRRNTKGIMKNYRLEKISIKNCFDGYLQRSY